MSTVWYGKRNFADVMKLKTFDGAFILDYQSVPYCKLKCLLKRETEENYTEEKMM